MTDRTVHRVLQIVALAGAALVALAFAFGTVRTGIGALVGASVAVANLIAMRFIVARVFAAAELSDKLGMVGLLIAKMTALFAVTGILIGKGWVDGVGFALGLGALVIGSAAAAFVATGDEPATQGEG